MNDPSAHAEPPAGVEAAAAGANGEPASWGGVALALSLAACATLLFEIALTRLFSVILWYHYGFMVISLALLGIGLSGVFVYLYPERFRRADAARQAALASVVFAVTTVVALCSFHWLVSVRTTWPLSTTELGLAFLIMTVPFFFGGLAIAIPLSRFTERIGPLYSADLLGAAIGAVLVIPLLSLLGAHRTILVAACIASLAAVAFAHAQGNRAWKLGGGIALAGCLGVLVLAGPTDLFRIRFSKHGEESDVIFEKWNAFSRITVVESPAFRRWGWNMSKKAPRGKGVQRHRIRIDGGAGTPLFNFSGDLAEVDFLPYDISSLGYQVRPQANVLIIGAGGGRDILTAKSLGIADVHGVEINPIIVDVVRHEFPDFHASAYDRPGVTWTVTDGRNYLATSKEHFDHIQISAVDTIAASASGALALVEQSLYTTEAFREYFDHLAQDGILSITRPFNTRRVEVTLRTVDLVRAAWHERGVEDPGQHLVVIGGGDDEKGSVWGLMLASRSPFTAEDLGVVRRLCRDLRFHPLYLPGDEDNVPEIEEILGPSRESFLASFELNVAATTDDRPYFFYFRKPWSALVEALPFGSEGSGTRARAAPDLLTKLFFFVLILTITTAFLLPMALGRLKLREARGSGTTLMYFAGIGLGFILVEIALLQRYTLVLGRPVYAFAVILSTMLVFSGAGSFLSHRVRKDRLVRTARAALGAVLVGIALHAWLMPGVLDAGMHWSLPLRLLLTIGSIAPLALLMGVALPTGMRLMQENSPQALAWAWGVNGSLSVLGTVIAMCVSVFFGITASLLLGLAAYALALLTPWKTPRASSE